MSGGGAEIGKDATFENCLLKGPVIATSNYDPDDVDSLHYRLNFDKCVFDRGGSVALTGWGGTQLNRMSCNITDCVFFMDDIGPKIQWRAGNINVTNAEIKVNENDYNRLTDNFSSFANYVGVLNDFTPEKRSRLLINNANVEKYYNGGFITSSSQGLPSSDSVIVEVRNSDINTAEFVGISTTYKPLIVNISNSKIRNLITRDEIKVLSLREEINQAPYVENETFRTFPTAHDALKFAYDNVVNISLDKGRDWVINTDGAKQVNAINITNSTDDWYGPVGDDGRLNLNHNFFGTVNFLSRDTLMLIPSQFDTTSNLVLADTLTVLPNQRFSAKSQPYICLSDSTYLDTITVTLSAPASTREYQYIPNLSSTQIDPFIPGSISVLVNGAQVGIDNENQLIAGSTMQGAISYLRGTYRLTFDTAPTTGDEIKIAVERYYRPYWIGSWKILNAAESLVTDVSTLSWQAYPYNVLTPIPVDTIPYPLNISESGTISKIELTTVENVTGTTTFEIWSKDKDTGNFTTIASGITLNSGEGEIEVTSFDSDDLVAGTSLRLVCTASGGEVNGVQIKITYK